MKHIILILSLMALIAGCANKKVLVRKDSCKEVGTGTYMECEVADQ